MVVKNFKEKLIAYLEIPYPITIVMVILPFLLGYLFTGEAIGLNIIFIAIGLMFSYIGGFNTLNAISDIKLDKISKAHRPLPSGRLSIFEAVNYTFALFCFFLVCSFFLYSVYVFGLCVLMVLTGILYSYFIRLKAIPVIANIYLGLVYTFFPLFLGWALLRDYLSFPIIPSLLIFLFTTLVLVCKDFEDYFADKKNGVITFVNFFGIKKSIWLIACCFFVLFLLIFIVATLRLISINYLAVLVLAPSIFYTFYYFSKNQTVKCAFSIFKLLTVQVIVFQLIVTIIYVVN